MSDIMSIKMAVIPIAKMYGVKRIYLFGSYAKGDANENSDVIILRKILEYCKQAEESCNMFENDYNKFMTVSVFQNACCMCVLQIGELCKLISKELRNKEKDIPWKDWCGIRDIFAHQYSNLYC